jgi:hypothetical protein
MSGSTRPSGLFSLPRGEVVLPFPDDPLELAPARNYRSTWVLSSLSALKEFGHYERYLTLLPPQHHQTVLFAVAGLWLPMPVARAHYDACEALGLTHEQQVEMGMSVGKRAQGTILSTAVAMAKVSGVTPWTVLPQYDRLYRRGVDGGACAVFKLGPKEARIEFVGCELFDVAYFRTAFCGVLLNIASLFCTKAYVHDETRRPRANAAFKFQWA